MKALAPLLLVCAASLPGPAAAAGDAPTVVAVDVCGASPADLEAFVARGVYGPNGPSPVFEDVFMAKCLSDGRVEGLLTVAPPQSLIDPALSFSLINPDAGPLDWIYDACRRSRPEAACNPIKAKAASLKPPAAAAKNPPQSPARSGPAVGCESPPCLLFADSDRRELTREELEGLSAADLRLARNEIFARHGYDFQSADLREHFAGFSWYVPQSRDIDGKLSAVEKANIKTIRALEKR